jgi:hypothetical protein
MPILSRWNSRIMAGVNEPIIARSRYIMKVMQKVRRRTLYRAWVGALAPGAGLSGGWAVGAVRTGFDDIKVAGNAAKVLRLKRPQ